jgi:formate hydrogenlyase transcriptional activator
MIPSATRTIQESSSEPPHSLFTGVTEAISTNGDLTALFRDLARRLPEVVPSEYIALFLHDGKRDTMRIHMLGTADADSVPAGSEVPIDESFSGLVFKTQKPLIVPDLSKETRFPNTAYLRPIGVESFCMFPLTTTLRRLGAIAFGGTTTNSFKESELEFLGMVADQVAVAVDNVLHHEAAQSAERQLRRERDRLRLLLAVNNAVVSNLGMDALFSAVVECLNKAIQQDGCSLLLFEPETGEFRCHVLFKHRRSNQDSFVEEKRSCSDMKSPASVAFTTRRPAVFGERELRELSLDSKIAKHLLDEGLKSVCCVPLVSHERVLGTLNIGRLGEHAFTPDDVELLSQVAQQIAIAVENGQAYRQIAELKEQLSKEKLYLEDEIRTERNFEEIIGESGALRHVLKQVEIVAPTDSTVLIQGETGTGKELIARAIHGASGRRTRTFVKLNCAAIPTGLLESELFGHEKGAFTGAIAQKIGRFELAHGGTLFLDEVGDIPLELQPKFLRVLQEHEFERLGSTKTIRVDIRLVAATNRDLAKMVSDKEFRSDLYYRLNVFPIMNPPLRDRQEDIAPLVRYFTQKFARRMNRRIDMISTETMKALSAYHWPGNIRELENFVERAVILSRGPNLVAPVAELRPLSRPRTLEGEPEAPLTTLEQAERDHIRRALQEAGWLVGGPSGAAAKLGMKRTTLQSKIAKLGIERPAMHESAPRASAQKPVPDPVRNSPRGADVGS